MLDPQDVARALEAVAQRWRDPDHAPRAEAVAATLEAENRFTEEAVAFAVNQQMEQIRADALLAWRGDRQARTPLKVGVLGAGNVPLADLQDFLAVAMMGHAYLGSVSSKSPHMLPAFVGGVRGELPGLEARFVAYDEMLPAADAVIATGSDETIEAVSADFEAAGIPAENRLLRGSGFGVAVIDGRESAAEREALAEDALLHEGLGCRNVAVIFAPEGVSPDPYLDAFAHFRGVFPSHPRTPGSLKMHQAMLAAVDFPHAYGEGLEFLVSKGEPEVQAPGHIRWAEYREPAEAAAWIDRLRSGIQVVVAAERVAKRLGLETFDVVAPGEAQRPPLDWWPDGRDVIEFLANLRAKSGR